ncbi:MAG: GNAT family N-acetyltransferase [Spirochaetales bacterium]|jgi:GNAT superfamily N-acetyltransferase|nr:GNAT family N-acetyltransferase [Spirochaetales bacterium]
MHQEENIKIKPVDKNNWADFELLFESTGGPKYCWCMVWRMTKDELKQNNSICRKNFIKQRVWSNIPIGILGYFDDEPFAWCSIAPRETHQRLCGDENLKNVWSITCFFIKKQFRKQGITKYLIEKAKDYAKENGAEYIESYPVEPDSPSYRFMGFVKTFEKAGFKFVRMAGTRRHVMICNI